MYNGNVLCTTSITEYVTESFVLRSVQGSKILVKSLRTSRTQSFILTIPVLSYLPTYKLTLSYLTWYISFYEIIKYFETEIHTPTHMIRRYILNKDNTQSLFYKPSVTRVRSRSLFSIILEHLRRFLLH